MSFDDLNRSNIETEVADRFADLMAALNHKDVTAWEKHYSTEGFVSAVAGGEPFATRQEWVEAVSSLFSMREYQHVEMRDMRVIPLARDVAMLISRDTTEMKLESGERTRYRHAFTMIWRKGHEGWQIVHSHESWTDEIAK